MKISALVTGVLVLLIPLVNFGSPDEDLVKREQMVKISRQLGVTCNHCHDVKNFRSEKMETFKIAREHIKIVDILNVHGISGTKPVKADCYMCHRGKAVPDYKEPKVN